jgi:hypothetical protein
MRRKYKALSRKLKAKSRKQKSFKPLAFGFLLSYTIKYPEALDVFLIAGIGYTVVNPENKALHAYIKLAVVGIAFGCQKIGTNDLFQLQLL